MELQTVEKKYGNPISDRCVAKVELLRFAKRLVKYTEKSENAKLELLYSLPGIFAMELRFLGAKVRIIKEGATFRIMDRSEKSRNLLTVTINDGSVLKKLTSGNLTACRAAAEGRLTFKGSTAFFCVFMRVCRFGDKELLSESRYAEAYDSEK